MEIGRHPTGRASSEQGDARQVSESGHEPVLELGIERIRGRLLLFAVMPIAATDPRGGVSADGEPGLCEMPQRQIIGGSRAAHLRRNPTRVDGIAQHVRPPAGHSKGKRGNVELALGISRPGSQRRSSQSMSRSDPSAPRCRPLVR